MAFALRHRLSYLLTLEMVFHRRFIGIIIIKRMSVRRNQRHPVLQLQALEMTNRNASVRLCHNQKHGLTLKAVIAFMRNIAVRKPAEQHEHQSNGQAREQKNAAEQLLSHFSAAIL